jgi:hypothetical protein
VKHWVGVGMSIGGGVSAGLGGLLLALSTEANSNAEELAIVYGVTYLVTGIVLLAIGLPLSASSTSVQVR